MNTDMLRSPSSTDAYLSWQDFERLWKAKKLFTNLLSIPRQETAPPAYPKLVVVRYFEDCGGHKVFLSLATKRLVVLFGAGLSFRKSLNQIKLGPLRSAYLDRATTVRRVYSIMLLRFYETKSHIFRIAM